MEKEQEAKSKEFNENNKKELIKELLGRRPEERGLTAMMAIAERVRKYFEEKKKLDDLFKAAVKAGLVEEERLP